MTASNSHSVTRLVKRVKCAAFGFRLFARYRIRTPLDAGNPTGRFSLASLPAETRSASNRACTAAVAPVRLVCHQSFDHSEGSGRRWPVVGHIVAALDNAQDKARGLEALSDWQLEGIVRAW